MVDQTLNSTARSIQLAQSIVTSAEYFTSVFKTNSGDILRLLSASIHELAHNSLDQATAQISTLTKNTSNPAIQSHLMGLNGFYASLGKTPVEAQDKGELDVMTTHALNVTAGQTKVIDNYRFSLALTFEKFTDKYSLSEYIEMYGTTRDRLKENDTPVAAKYLETVECKFIKLAGRIARNPSLKPEYYRNVCLLEESPVVLALHEIIREPAAENRSIEARKALLEMAEVTRRIHPSSLTTYLETMNNQELPEELRAVVAQIKPVKKSWYQYRFW